MTPSARPSPKFCEIPAVQAIDDLAKGAGCTPRRWTPAERRVLPFPRAETPYERTRRVFRRYVFSLDYLLFFAGFCTGWLLFLGLLLYVIL